ncbi:Anion/proton exchange transporter [Balamuthia mandrillaris]
MGFFSSFRNEERRGGPRRTRAQSAFMSFESAAYYDTVEEGQDDNFFLSLVGGRRIHLPLASLSWWNRLVSIFFGATAQQWCFLMILGVLAALSAYAIDYSIFSLYRLQVYITSRVDIFVLNYAIWLCYSLFFLTIAVGCVEYISPHSSGSGIPEMKSILSGIVLQRYLSIRTFVAKVLGLIAAFAGGLSIGKEGPYVHISSIIARQMFRIPFFTRIKNNEVVKQQMLAAACAVGVATSFGAPVGGVLFSVEVISTYYMVENLWKGFFCALCGAIVIKVWSLVAKVGIVYLFSATVSEQTYDLKEFVPFLVMGIVGGIVGGLLVRLVSLVIYVSLRLPFLRTKKGHLIQVLCVGTIVALITFPVSELRNDQQDVIAYLLQDEAVGEWITITWLFIGKLLLTIISISFTRLPSGLYTPVFIIGAIQGRLFGEAMAAIFPSLAINPSGYAIVGAAALSAGATRTISTAVLVVELTGQLNLLLPNLVAVLAACAVGSLISHDIYEVLLQQKGLPISHSAFRIAPSYQQTARDVMRTDLQYLTTHSTFEDARDLIAGDKHKHTSYPLVESDENMIFLGSFKRTEIESFLAHYKLDINSKVSANTTRQRPPSSSLASSSASYGSSSTSSSSLLDDSDAGGAYSSDNSEDLALSPRIAPVEGSFDDGKLIDIEAVDENASLLGNLLANVKVEWKQRSEEEELLRMKVPYVFISSASVSVPSAAVIRVDPTAFQIVEQTSLFKVHFTFTMLGLTHAFVTSRGKLVGVITRRDLLIPKNKRALEEKNRARLQSEPSASSSSSSSSSSSATTMHAATMATTDRLVEIEEEEEQEEADIEEEEEGEEGTKREREEGEKEKEEEKRRRRLRFV